MKKKYVHIQEGKRFINLHSKEDLFKESNGGYQGERTYFKESKHAHTFTHQRGLILRKAKGVIKVR